MLYDEQSVEAHLALCIGAKAWRAIWGIAGRRLEAAGAKALRKQRMPNIVCGGAGRLFLRNYEWSMRRFRAPCPIPELAEILAHKSAFQSARCNPYTSRVNQNPLYAPLSLLHEVARTHELDFSL